MPTPLSPASLMREVARLYVRAQRAQAACRDGASTVQCHVLTELLRQDGLTQQALVERLGLDKAWLSRAVDALVELGAVRKQVSPSDRRSVNLSLTRDGRARANKLERELNGHVEKLMDTIPKSSHAQIQESLQCLLDALQRNEPGKPSASSGKLGHKSRAVSAVGMTVRPALAGDWMAVKRLLTSAKLPLEGAREHLDQFLVGVLDTKLACTAGVEMYGPFALLRSVAVAEALRGRGCARKLIAKLLHKARAQGVSQLFLLTTTAAPYFAKLGFTEVARDAVPQALAQSREFQGAGPDSATAMVLQLNA